MPFTSILKNIAKHIHLTDEEAAHFTHLLHYREIKKKDYLLKQGQECRVISYVNEGALRAFHLDKNDRDSTIMFAVKDWWITDMYCFIKKQPSMQYIVAIKDTAVWQLAKDDLEKLYTDIPKFERFFRIVMQNSYIREQVRVLQNLSLSAEERYYIFMEKYPQLMPHVTQKHIASYLGITPEFLSAIRKNIARKPIS